MLTGTVQVLVRSDNRAKLTTILLLHIMSGKVMANDITDKVMDPAIACGATVHVNGSGGVTVNRAKVVTFDIACSNGVIRGLDAVLLPRG